MDKTEAIRAFSRVVEEGSFAAAARSLGVTRSAVSKCVRALEEELGAQLFQRSTRKVSPTETGLAFNERCLIVLAELDAAFRAVSRLQGDVRGRLRINAPMSLGTLHLSRVVADFMAKFQKLQVEVVLNDRFVDPIEEGFDVTIRVARPSTWRGAVNRAIPGNSPVIGAFTTGTWKPGVPGLCQDRTEMSRPAFTA
jgi:DNA-binding transcriptional LysR family regulator